jgi:uncharacterized protein with HEPN domain
MLNKSAASLHDMLHAANKALELASGMDEHAFLTDEKTQWAVYSQIIILGEAANRILKQEQDHLPDIPWKLIVGMRNRLVHGYDDIVWERVWATLAHDLPPLVTYLKLSLKNFS